MSPLVRSTLLGLVTGAAIAASTSHARAAPEPPLAIQEAALTRWVFGHNSSAANTTIACKAQTGACVPGSSHLTFVAPVAVPAMAGCASGATAIMTCYKGAIEITQQALEQGKAHLLFEGAQRMKDVAARADVTATAPAWMKSASAQNLLYRFYKDQGMPLTALGACATGTEKQRYQCLGGTTGPSSAVYRAAIGILDRHSDILINWGRTTGARTRLEQIFRSAMAPGVSAMTSANRFDPRLGRGLPRLDLLGKIGFLRFLTNEAASVAGERAYFDALTAYQVDTASPKVSARLATYAGWRAARWSNPATGGHQLVDAAIDTDLINLANAHYAAVHLALVRGSNTLARVAGQNTADSVAWRVAPEFDRAGLDVRFDDLLTEYTPISLNTWYDGTGVCDWFTENPISITMYYPVTTTERVWISDCIPRIPGSDCDPDTDGHWETFTTTTWIEGPTIQIGEDIIADSIRHNYHDLLESDAGVSVDRDGNGADIDLEDVAGNDNATIARAGISATECFPEMTSVSGGYQHTLTSTSLTCNDGGAHCQDDYGGSNGRMFIPYALAARLCPNYTSRAVGIDAVSLTAGGNITGEDASCPTPVEYVARVADLFELGESAYLQAVDDKQGELDALLADFAFEANLLTAPVAGTLRQRADLAYFSVEPLAGCGDTPFGDCVGLDVWGARLDQAEDAIAKGLALYRQFSRVDRSDPGIDGDDAIGTWAEDGAAVCEACSGACSDCLEHSRAQIRGLGFRRLRDALGAYQSIQADQLELARRQIDAMPSTCVTVVDDDGDGVGDRTDCLQADPVCTPFCPMYDGLVSRVDDVVADMAIAVADLDEQGAVVSAAGGIDLADFIADISGWAAGISGQAAAHLAAVDAGVDWLGQRKGRYAVAIGADGLELVDAIEADLADLQQRGVDLIGDYGGWVNGYLDDLARKTDFANEAAQVALSVQTNIAGYCHDQNGAPVSDGCGLAELNNDTLLNKTNGTALRVNGTLASEFCRIQLSLFPTVVIDLVDPNDPDYLAPGDPYLAWVVSQGLTPCPQLDTVDIDGLLAAGYGGSLIEHNVIGMDLALRNLESAVRDFHAYAETVQYAADLFESYENAISTYFKKKAFREWLNDTVVCGAAVIGATAVTIGSSGVGAGVWIGAASTCIERYAVGAANLFPNDGNMSAEELQFEGTYINQAVNQAEQLYALTQKLEAVLMRVADYQAQVTIYKSQLGDYQRTVAFGNTQFDALGIYQEFSDPLYLAIEQQLVDTLKFEFRDYAKAIADAHRKIEYDMGNYLPVGEVYPRTAFESFWVPRTADLTIAAPASILPNAPDFDVACDLLAMVGAAPPPAEDQTLVGAACMLTKIYDDFREVYGQRPDHGAIAYVGSAVPGLTDLDANGIQDLFLGAPLYSNKGELAMLGDSRFYYQAGPTATGCAVGWVDVSDYCHTFSNSATPPAPGNCANIRTMPVATRLSLAHLDHLARTPGRETFDCTVDAAGYHIAPKVGSGVNGVFTGGPLGDLPFHQHAAPWHRDVDGVVDETFYQAQTPTVQALIDTYLDGVLDQRYELPATMEFFPGSQVYQVAMDDAVFDPEGDLLDSAVPAAQTMSEQIDAIAVVCTGSSSCGTSGAVQDSRPIDMVLFGPAYKGSRCTYEASFADASDLRYGDGSTRQAQIEYEMDHALSAGTIPTFNTALPENEPLIEAALETATTLQRPLHVSRMLFSVYALYDANSGLSSPAMASPWHLYIGDSADPRLRIVTRYDYYNTDPDPGPDGINVDDFLVCPANSVRI